MILHRALIQRDASILDLFLIYSHFVYINTKPLHAWSLRVSSVPLFLVLYSHSEHIGIENLHDLNVHVSSGIPFPESEIVISTFLLTSLSEIVICPFELIA